MKRLVEVLVCLSAIAGVLSFLRPLGHREEFPVQPVIIPIKPDPRPDADKRRRPHHPRHDAEGVDLIEAGPNAPDGTEPAVDFPDAQWMKNIGSKKDGAGMCVFTSMEHSMRWAGQEEWRGFRDWCAEKYPGGGYPQKLAQLMKAYAQAKGLPEPVLVQYEESDLGFLEKCIKNGWLPCCTLYHSPRYGGGVIYHMVNCAHLDSKQGAILDNNFKPLEWITGREEFQRRISMNGKYWGAVVICPPPPPNPKN